jgi:hypothetical protein
MLNRFKLTSPQKPGEAQAMLGIKQEGSFVLNVKVMHVPAWHQRTLPACTAPDTKPAVAAPNQPNGRTLPTRR